MKKLLIAIAILTIVASLSACKANSKVSNLTAIVISTNQKPAVAVDSTIQLEAIGVYSNGKTQDISSEVKWGILPQSTGKAIITDNGLAIATIPGNCMVTAKLGNVSDEGAIHVVAQ
jgi:hypothetical protein